MSTPRTCPECGAVLDSNAPDGLCPNCRGQSTVREQQETTARIPTELITEPHAERIGNYKLLQKIGEGGFGVVYMADQEQPVKRRVALKVIKLGMDTRQVIARFEAERQALALMDHPNIARVFDGGATDAGRPYFVMELVKGIKITQYCDQNHVGLKERLDLFLQVCQAIQHAHQKGIIHRDIKPSNIMVTMHDGQPVPKVIDFGIAKATEQRLTDKTLFTQYEQFMGTPAYMSPEQAEMTGLDIDTRSDIYSLGVLLYELLTGRTPFDNEALLHAGIDEVRRIIREQEPVRPSTKLNQTRAAAEASKSKIQNPKSKIDRDLDWIVMKCLEKDRTRRYETTNGLAMDIKRYLNQEPVIARPPSNIYRFQKLVRRNKAAVAAAAMIITALIVGLGAATWSLLRERAARAEAEDNRQLAEDRLYVADMNLGYQALLDSNFARVRELLAVYRYQKPDRRGFEWRYLWNRARGEFEREFLGHSASINKVAFSPDGRVLVTHSMDRTLKVWNVDDGKERLTLTNISALGGFSADGTRLFLGQNSTSLVAYDFQKAQLHPLLQDIGNLVTVLADDHTAATTGTNFAVRLWNMTTGQMTLELPGVGGFLQRGSLFLVPAVAVSRDGKRAAVANQAVAGVHPVETITVWDLMANKELITVPEHRDIHSIQFSPDGSLLAVGGTGAIVKLWNIGASGKPGELHGHDGSVRGLAFSRDGKILATGSSDQTIKLWDVDTGENLATLKGHEHSIPALAFIRDGQRLASGSLDETVKIWNLGRPAAVQMISGIKMLTGGGAQPVLSNDGGFVAALCQTNEIKIWDTASLRLVASLRGAGMPLQGGFSRDGKTLLTFRNRNSLRLYQISSQAVLKETLLENPPRTYYSATLSTAGDLLAVSDENNNVSLWNTSTGLKKTNFIGVTAPVSALSFSPNDVVLAGIEVQRSSTNRVSYTHRLHFWGGQPLAPLTPLVVQDVPLIQSFAFSPDGRFVATAGSQLRVFHLWELTPRRLVATFTGHRQQIPCLAFSPEGRLLATASSDGTLKLWDLTLRQEIATLKFNEAGLKGVDARVETIAFSRDGSVLMAVSNDETAMRFFRAPTWDEIAAAEKAASQ